MRAPPDLLVCTSLTYWYVIFRSTAQRGKAMEEEVRRGPQGLQLGLKRGWEGGAGQKEDGRVGGGLPTNRLL